MPTKMAYKRMIGVGGVASRFVICEKEDQHLSQIATSDKYQFIVLAPRLPLRAAQTATGGANTASRTDATQLDIFDRGFA